MALLAMAVAALLFDFIHGAVIGGGAVGGYKVGGRYLGGNQDIYTAIDWICRLDFVPLYGQVWRGFRKWLVYRGHQEDKTASGL